MRTGRLIGILVSVVFSVMLMVGGSKRVSAQTMCEGGILRGAQPILVCSGGCSDPFNPICNCSLTCDGVTLAEENCAHYIDESSCNSAGFETSWSCGGGGMCSWGGVGGGSTGCGNAAWPSCQGSCPSGTVCKSGSSAPCACGVATACSDYVQVPENLSVTRTSPTSAHVTWTKSPSMYVTRQVLTMCVAGSPSQCPVDVSLDDNVSSYDATGVLTAGTYYVAKVTFHAEGAPGTWSACERSSNVNHLSSCQLTPSPTQIEVGAQATLTTGLVANSAVNYQVDYLRTNGTGQVTITPETDYTHPFSTRVSGVANGTATVRGRVYVGGTAICQNTATVNVGNSCSASAPTTLSLVSPSNGATVTGPTVDLDWNAPSSWGEGCPSDNTYKVYVQESATPINPSILWVSRAWQNSFANNYPVEAGKTYYWKVEANNGSLATPSTVWHFTVPLGCSASAPAEPTLVSPSNGAVVPVSPVTLLWNILNDWGEVCSPDIADNAYRLYVDTFSPPANLVATQDSWDASYAGYPVADGETYYWRVVADNGAESTASDIWSFTAQEGCSTTSPATPILVSPGNGVTLDSTAVTLDWSAIGSWGTACPNNNQYEVYIQESTVPITPTSLWTSVSPPTSQTSFTAQYGKTYYWRVVANNGSLSAPSTTWSFTVLENPPPSNTAWWQGVGAGVYAGSEAGGLTIRSVVPSGSYLLVPGTTGSVASLMRTSGTYEVGSGSLSSSAYNALTKYRGKRMDYAYFGAQMGLVASSPQLPNLDVKPVSGEGFYYISGDTTLGGWSVGSGESYSVFVDGDLTIGQNVTVAPGGFLLLVVSGDITVSPAVTTMQGLYVTSGVFTTETAGVGGDTQLVVSGSVVGWGGVELNRDLGGVWNNSPSEQFVYRPDLLTAMPKKIKTFVMQWEEVAAGTLNQ